MFEIAYIMVHTAAWVALAVSLFIGTWQIVDSYTKYHFKKLYAIKPWYSRWVDALLTSLVSWTIIFLTFLGAIIVIIGLLTLFGF